MCLYAILHILVFYIGIVKANSKRSEFDIVTIEERKLVVSLKIIEYFHIFIALENVAVQQIAFRKC